jgi:hypothetical protein
MIRLDRVAKYGSGTEKLSDAQLELLDLEPWGQQRRSPSREAVPALGPKKERYHPGRQELPANLPRGSNVHSCQPAFDTFDGIFNSRKTTFAKVA